MKGKIRVLAGAGRIKNAAILGLALRAVGNDCRVYIARFLRPWKEEEWKGLAHLDGQVMFRHFRLTDPQEKEIQKIEQESWPAAQEALEEIGRAIKSQEYSLVILDEINLAACFGFLSIEDLLSLIAITPEKVELVLTGNCPDPRIIWQADSVTTFQEIKTNECGCN